jgi:hypothetical protein
VRETDVLRAEIAMAFNDSACLGPLLQDAGRPMQDFLDASQRLFDTTSVEIEAALGQDLPVDRMLQSGWAAAGATLGFNWI